MTSESKPETTTHVSYVCTECKSTNVWFDALVCYDEDAQDFVVENIFDDRGCSDCYSQNTIERVVTLTP